MPELNKSVPDYLERVHGFEELADASAFLHAAEMASTMPAPLSLKDIPP